MIVFNRLSIVSGLVAAMLVGTAGAANIAAHVVRSKVDGIDVVAYPTAVKDVVTIQGALPGGDAFAGSGNAAVPSLVGMMLDRGTTKEDRFQIAQKLESVGAQLNFFVNAEMVLIRAKCLKKDLPLVIQVLAEELRTPAFSASELSKAQQQLQGALKRALESTDSRASEAFERAVYPHGHPNHPVAAEAMMTAVGQASIEEIRRFHAQHYGPAHMILVLVGDVDVPKAQGEIKKAFAGWTGGSSVAEAARAPSTTAREETVAVPGKTSVSIVVGAGTGLRYRDPDALAMRTGTAVLGSGFTGRLMGTVRDKEGLTYGINAGTAGDMFTDGDWRIRATFAPSLIEKGLASTHRELLKWWNQGITAEELAARKANLIGSYQVSLSSTDGLAGTLLATIERGYGVSWLDEYPKAISALTLEQVNGAIRKYLDPDKMVLVRAGTL